jgi:galactose mutarotase-like enzyme
LSTLKLAGAGARAEIAPERGARVQHLVDAETGRELLWQSAAAEEWPRADFMSSVSGGWDNIFPNDHPWNGYPDHGLVWSSGFEVLSSSDSEVTLRASLSAPDVEITQRYVLLPGPRRGLRQTTTLAARSDTGPFFWASHPMLAVAPGWKIELPATEIRTDPEYSGRLPKGTTLQPGKQDEALTVEPHESCFELRFASGIDEATVRSPDGSFATRLGWDSTFLEHVWIVTISNFPPVDLALQLETSSSHTFALGDAIEAGTAVSLAGGSERSFWVEIESLDQP